MTNVSLQFEVYKMLLAWKELDGDQTVLEQALQSSGMIEAAQILTK